MKLGKRRVGAASLELGHSDALPESLHSVVEVSSVWVDPWHRKKGIANRLMDEVCEDADKSQTVLMLQCDAGGWLEQWYREHGFVTLQDIPVFMMVRPPYKQ
jgi:predicted GNAT family N-acyltransferase